MIDRLALNQLSERVIGAAQQVSTVLGPGFLEKVYENALCWELRKAQLEVSQQWPFAVTYDGRVVGNYVADLCIASCLILEIKCAKHIDDSHRRQCLNYLRAAKLPLGLVLNFGSRRLEVARMINGW